MDSATALLHALAGEESRWTAQSKEFDSQIQRLTGDCAVASAFVSYLGPFNKEFRELLMARDFYGDCVKLGIPVTNNIQVGQGALLGASNAVGNKQERVGRWTSPPRLAAPAEP
jgi:dynein heavy chain